MHGKHRSRWSLSSLVAVLSLASLPAVLSGQGQEAPTPAGHWQGAILIPGTPLEINVDLAVAPDGAWSGDISIPAQQTEDYPLADVTVTGKDVSFRMADVPGDPVFKGTLSEDGKTLSGRFSQGGADLEFRLTRGEGGGSGRVAPPQP